MELLGVLDRGANAGSKEEGQRVAYGGSESWYYL